jgi:uracil-DNA glycosylase family 4
LSAKSESASLLPKHPADRRIDVALARFWRTALHCRVCPGLAPWRKFPPSARGTGQYHLMILGEAPGRVSLENRRPFSNPRNLVVRNAFARAIAPLKIEPDEIFYFSDTVKCWPSSKSGANRSPTQGETVTRISRHLGRELEIVRPLVIFAFGARAVTAALGTPVRMAELHGTTVENRTGVRVIPLMHPSTINIAGMRRVGIRSLDDYQEKLAALFHEAIFCCDSS